MQFTFRFTFRNENINLQIYLIMGTKISIYSTSPTFKNKKIK